MGDVAKGAVIGVVVALLGLGLLVEMSGILTRPPPRLALSVVSLAPDGADAFGENLVDAPMPGSAGYGLCFGELRVKRPSMMITGMPDSFCTLRRGPDGRWLVSTGGWQSCTVACVRAGG